MTTLQAYDILAISQDAGFKEVKKQYRQLMHRVHPDSGAFGTEEYPYTAQEINEAYETLRQADRETDAHALKRSSRNSSERKKHSQTASQTAWHAKYGQSQRNAEMGWDAPENTGAYTKRKIFHKVEDMDGTMIGVVAIAEGKYLWKPEEDFSLFLKSILECSERLLAEIDESNGMSRQAPIRLRFQAELAYLLAQQFIDGADSMEELLTPVETGEKAETYYIPAMLEAGGTTVGLRTGMILYPAGVRAHRLYLKTKTGKEAGYLSFRDDRLYHIVIPLLEQKRAQVKIEVSRKQDRKNTSGKSKYKNIDFWMRIPRETTGTFPESIDLKIENLLKQYEGR